jgi:hypothetical protein
MIERIISIRKQDFVPINLRKKLVDKMIHFSLNLVLKTDLFLQNDRFFVTSEIYA